MKIKVTSPSFSSHPILIEELKSNFDNIVLNDTNIHFKDNILKEYLFDADIAIIGLETIDKELIDSCPKLKFIAKYGVGLDNIDIEYCKEKNIQIGWTSGVNKVSVAEMTLGFMITTIRNMVFTSYELKSGLWNKSGGNNLSNKVIGIIGIGNIGKEVIKLLQPFNCKILVNDIFSQDEFYKKYKLLEVTKEEIFTNSDIISVHTPLTKETKYMFNLEVFKKMKKTAILINTARGEIVNNNDLKIALKDKLIAAAALDTYEKEPNFDKELINQNRLFCTPHIGGNSEESILLMGRSAIKYIKEFLGEKKI